METISLNTLPLNTVGTIVEVNCNPSIKRRLLDLGLIPNTKIIPIFKSIGGDPIAYEVRGTTLAIRNEDAKNILVNEESDLCRPLFVPI